MPKETLDESCHPVISFVSATTVILGVGVLGDSQAHAAETSRPELGTRFEYRVLGVRMSHLPSSQIEGQTDQELDRLGNEGWELVAAHPNGTDQTVYVFTRVKH